MRGFYGVDGGGGGGGGGGEAGLVEELDFFGWRWRKGKVGRRVVASFGD